MTNQCIIRQWLIFIYLFEDIVDYNGWHFAGSRLQLGQLGTMYFQRNNLLVIIRVSVCPIKILLTTGLATHVYLIIKTRPSFSSCYHEFSDVTFHCQIVREWLAQGSMKARNNKMKPIWQNGYDWIIIIFWISMSLSSINVGNHCLHRKYVNINNLTRILFINQFQGLH